jgi:hypothetical protein
MKSFNKLILIIYILILVSPKIPFKYFPNFIFSADTLPKIAEAILDENTISLPPEHQPQLFEKIIISKENQQLDSKIIYKMTFSKQDGFELTIYTSKQYALCVAKSLEGWPCMTQIKIVDDTYFEFNVNSGKSKQTFQDDSIRSGQDTRDIQYHEANFHESEKGCNIVRKKRFFK